MIEDVLTKVGIGQQRWFPCGPRKYIRDAGAISSTVPAVGTTRYAYSRGQATETTNTTVRIAEGQRQRVEKTANVAAMRGRGIELSHV